MFNIINAVILGLVEGITEFLPISSTAHLILASDVLKLVQTDYLKSFEISIQLGAILAVVFLYWRDFLNIGTLKKIILAFIPTGIAGYFLYKVVKSYLLGNIVVVLIALAAGGLFLILFERIHKDKKEAELPVLAISNFNCLVIGLFQAISMIPGVSRSAATIIGGLILKIPRLTIVKFSFLLAVPTMAAATGYDLMKNAGSFNSGQFQFLAVGFIVSFLSAVVAIRWLLAYVKNHTFLSFGVYRIILVILFLLIFI